MKINVPSAAFYTLDEKGKLGECTRFVQMHKGLSIKIPDEVTYEPADFMERPAKNVPPQEATPHHDSVESYRIEIGADAQLLEYCEIDDATKTDPTIGDMLRAEIGEDASLLPVSACSVRTRPRKTASATRSPSTVSHPDCDGATMSAQKIAPVPQKTRNERLTEADYAATLQNQFQFGRFDGLLFVRAHDNFRLLTPNLVAQLLGQILSPADLKLFTVSSRRNIADHLDLISAADAPILQIPKDKLPLENGVFNLRTMALEAADPRSYYPVTIHACALSSPTPTPVWDQFLDDVSHSDKEITQRIHEFCAYLLFPGTPAKAFFVLADATDSGKSALLQFLARLYGEKSVAYASIHDFSNPFVVGSLKDCALNISADEPDGPLSSRAVGTLKSLTGDDSCAFNEKNMPIITRKVITKLVVATNARFIADKVSEAFSRRRILIPFLHSTPKERQDPNLVERLWKERNAIVTSLLPVAESLWRRKFRFSPCATAELMAAKWDGGHEIVRYFLNHHYRKDANSRISSEALYRHYVRFCRENDIAEESQKFLIQAAIHELGAVPYHSYDRGLRGIACVLD